MTVALSAAQQTLLQAIFDHFTAEGRWPKYWELGRELVGKVDVGATARSLPPGLINASAAVDATYYRGEYGSDAFLFIPALQFCQGAETDLADFMRVLQLCLVRHSDPTIALPRITTTDLRQELHMSELQARKVFLLLAVEPGLTGSGLRSNDEAVAPSYYDISPDIERYRGATSLDGYLAARPSAARSPIPQPVTTAEDVSTRVADSAPGPDHAQRRRTTPDTAQLSPSPEASRPLKVFYSYSHRDERYREKLETHLGLLRREGVIEGWSDRRIEAGQDWKKAIDDSLNVADLILLLVSADFLSSEYCYEKEMRRALARHDTGQARVVPIILKPTDWHSAPFASIQALPRDAKAITLWRPQESGWADVARGLRSTARELQAHRQAAQDDPGQTDAQVEPEQQAEPGGSVAYVGPDGTIHLVTMPDGGDRAVPTRGPAFSLRWSPDGKTLLYGEQLGTAPYRNQIAVLDPSTGLSRALVAPEVRLRDDLGAPIEYWHYESIRWLPGGREVAYKKASVSRFHHAYMRVPIEGGVPQEVQGFGFFSATTAFDLSPTDGRMAMVENGLDHNAGGSQLAIVDADGTNGRILLPYHFGVFYYQPVWTPDGRAIGVAQQRKDQLDWTLFLLDPDSGMQRVLGTIPSQSRYAFSPNGAWLVLADGSTSELLLLSLARFNERRSLGHGTSPAWSVRH